MIMNNNVCESCKYRKEVNACIRCFNGSNFHPKNARTAEEYISYGDRFKAMKQLEVKLPNIKKVIFNPPATIVYWNDNIKTVVKAQEGEIFDPEKGLAMAISKRALGNKGNYFNQISKWTEEYDNITGPDYYHTFMEKFIVPNHRTLSDLLEQFYNDHLTNKLPEE